jgi:hypothetical protein
MSGRHPAGLRALYSATIYAGYRQGAAVHYRPYTAGEDSSWFEPIIARDRRKAGEF